MELRSGAGDGSRSRDAGYVLELPVHRDRMEQNIDVWDFELTADDMAQIAGLTLDHSEIVNHDDPAFVKMLHGVSSVRTRL